MYKLCKTEASSARQRQMAQGLLTLMQDKHYDLVSITDICNQLGISRNSFYRYFSGKDAALHALIDYALMDFDLHAHAAGFDPGQNNHQELVQIFSFWLGCKPLLDALEYSGLTGILIQRAVNYALSQKTFAGLMHIREKPLQDYAIRFAVCGIMTVLVQWHHDGFVRSVEEMATLVMRLLGEPVFDNSR